MQKQDNFKKIIIAVISSLVLLIIVLVFMVNAFETRLVGAKYPGSKEAADVRGQKIELEFSTPISKSASSVQIAVKAGNETTNMKIKSYIAAQKMVLTFSQNLDYDTAYSMSLKGLTDLYHKEIDVVEFNFKTKSPSLFYIEKTEKQNRLINYELKEDKKYTLFEAQNIEHYAFNSRYIVIVEEEATFSKMTILDAISREKLKELKFEYSQIGKIELSAEANRIVFTKQEYEFQNEFVVPTTGYKLFYYEIEKSKLDEFVYQDIEFDLNDFVFSPDGNFILVEDSTEGFYLVDLNDPTAGIPLGRYIATGGFNYTADKILFLSYEPENPDKEIFITSYDINKGEKVVTDGKYEVIDPIFFNNSNKLIYARLKDKINSRGIYKIVEANLEGAEASILDVEGYSLEYPHISYNDRYLAVEKYTYDSLKEYNYARSAGYVTKPGNAEIIIYDLLSKKIYSENIAGIEPKWNW